MDPASDVKRFHAVSLRIEAGREFAANCSGYNLFLRGGDGSFGVFTGEGGVHAVDFAEAPVVAHVIVVCVRVHHAYGQRREAFDHFPDVTDAHAGVKEQGLLFADDQVGDDFFLLVRLVDGEQSGADAIDLKPLVGDVDAFQLAIGGAREVAAPFGALMGLRN